MYKRQSVDISITDNDTSSCKSVGTEAVNTLPLVTASVNKENDTAVSLSADNELKSPSETLRRRNVFARSSEGSATRQRFNINATKDKVASPEPVVEVRSRSVSVLILL